MQLFIFSTIVGLLPLIEAHECLHFPLKDDDYYEKDMTLSQLYLMPVPCIGHIFGYTVQAYNAGSISIYIYIALPGQQPRYYWSISFKVQSPGRYYLPERSAIFLPESSYIGLNFDTKTGSILREHIVSGDEQGSEVWEYPGIYFIDGKPVVEHRNHTISKTRRIPSVQIRVTGRDHTSTMPDYIYYESEEPQSGGYITRRSTNTQTEEHETEGTKEPQTEEYKTTEGLQSESTTRENNPSTRMRAPTTKSKNKYSEIKTSKISTKQMFQTHRSRFLTSKQHNSTMWMTETIGTTQSDIDGTQTVKVSLANNMLYVNMWLYFLLTLCRRVIIAAISI